MHKALVTTGRGLRRDAFPMRLFEKAKRLGVWNPSDIDFSRDRADWQALNGQEQDLLLRLTALFQAGEEAVTADILPLIGAVAAEGRLEEELYLTTFLFEEAKHTDFFQRFLVDVAGIRAGEAVDLSAYHSPSYRALIYDALPSAMDRLRDDPSATAMVQAAVTYNMIVEGVMAETGYHGYLSALEANGLMPGQCRGIRLLKQDESRHIAYGIYLICRLIADDPALWDVAEETMNELLPHALGVIAETFAPYPVMPFGLEEDLFVHYALAQFQKRIERIERARTGTLAEVDRIMSAAVEDDDG